MTGFDFTRNQKLALYVLIGLSAIGLSVTHVRNSLGGGGEVVLREPGAPGSPRTVAADSDPMPGYGPSASTGRAVFQVAGCVNRPGVYSLAEDKRILDAISAAGGAKPNADLQALNLAAKIEDGSRIYVPPKGETGVPIRITTLKPAGETHRRASGSSSDKLRNPGEGVVRINTADAGELQRLPGVGPSTAEKIIDYRAQIGRFTSVEQLDDVKGIGPKKLGKMRPFVAL